MPISGKRIKQARELRGLTQEEIAKETGLSQALIAQIERGFRSPSEEMLSVIAERSGLPASFFIDDPLVEFSQDSLLFRTHVSVRKRESMKAIRAAELQFEIAHLMFKRLKFRPITIPRGIADPWKAARETRKRMGLSEEDPIKNIIHEI